MRYQSEHAGHDEFTVAGTLEDWRGAVAAACIGNPILALAVSAALAGPLLARLHRGGGGFHLVGDSSTGKSTALAAAASVWGGAGFVRTWRATGNGLEGIAAALNDTALILDEISEADPRELGAVVYAVGNGVGKSRASRTGSARPVKRWRVMLLSSGERTLAAAMQEGGKRTKAGQEARLLDVPCTRRHGIFDQLHGAASGRAMADSLRTATARYHGWAGPEFVRHLIDDTTGDLGELLATILARPAFASGSGLEGRAAGTFALAGLAGELATSYAITGWPEGAALDSAAMGYRLWREHRGEGQTETRQILEAVGDFLARHGDSRFSHVTGADQGPVVRDRAGWYRDIDEGRVYLMHAAGLREASQGFDFARVLEALDSAGWITDQGGASKSKLLKVAGRVHRVYAVAPKFEAAE